MIMKVLEIEHVTKKAGRRTLVSDMTFEIMQGMFAASSARTAPAKRR